MQELVTSLRGSRVIQNRTEHLSEAVTAAPKDGMLLEFGVYQGLTLNLIALLVKPRTVWGFDSFKGLPEPWVRGDGNVYQTGHFNRDGRLPSVEENAHLVPGWFDETLPGFLIKNDGPVSFVNIDCDLYSSTKTVLTLLSGRLLPGSVLFFDEIVDWTERHYPAWEGGEYRALSEWCREGSRSVRPVFRDGFMGATVVVE